MKRKILSTCLTTICLFLLGTNCFATNMYTWSITHDTSSDIESNAVAVNATVAENEETGNTLNLQSGSAILIEQTTGQVLYGYNVHEKLCPASVTK